MTNTDIAAPMAATTAKGRFSGAQQKLLAFGTLIILVIGFSLASPNFMQTSNILAILQATSVNGILAVAATLVIITGGIDLSVGTLMTFTAIIAGVVLTYWGFPLPIGIIASILTGALVGLTSGAIIAKMKIPPFIATLGMMLILKGLSLVISGTKPIYFNDTPSFPLISTESFIGDIIPGFRSPTAFSCSSLLQALHLISWVAPCWAAIALPWGRTKKRRDSQA